MDGGCGWGFARLVGMLGVAAALLVATVSPSSAGVSCALQATVGGGSATEVPIGETVLIEAFSFAAGDVEVDYEIDGIPLRSETITADGAGTFETTVTPVAGEEGLWTVIATQGVCTTEAGFLVVAGATPTPTATATPVASSLPNVAVTGDPPSWDGSALALGALTVLAAAALGRRHLAARR